MREAVHTPEREKFLLQQKCWRKRGWWRTLKAARRRAKEIHKVSGIQLYAYKCGYCGRAHLTKQKSAKGLVL